MLRFVPTIGAFRGFAVVANLEPQNEIIKKANKPNLLSRPNKGILDRAVHREFGPPRLCENKQ
jgi:hypothetical protein